MIAKHLRLNKTAVFAGVFSIALILRLIFIFQWDLTPYGPIPILDALMYDRWAQLIAQGHILHPKAFYTSPLFPYVLGLIYAVFGHDFLVVSLFNAVFGALTALILAMIGFALFGLEAGLIAGLLAAFYMPFVFYAAPVMKEPLALLLLSLFLLYAIRALQQDRRRDYAWSGAWLGFCVLARGNVLLLAPVMIIFAFLKDRHTVIRSAARNIAIFLAALVLCIAPATLHNYIVSDDFVLSNYTYGFDLYIGHSPSANGTNVFPPGVSSDPVQEEHTTTWTAQQALGHEVKPSEVSSYWSGRALDYMWHNPMQELVLLRNKIVAFWNATEAVDNYDIGFVRDNFDTVLALPLVEFWMLAAVAVFGAVAAWRERRDEVALLAVLTLVYAGSVLMFYVTDRYRLPVVVFLFPLVGAALPYGRKLVQARNWKRFGAALAFAAVSLWLSFLPFPGRVSLTAFNWGTLAVIDADEGEDDKALVALEKAIAVSSDNREHGILETGVGAQSYASGASIEQRLGRDDEAERFFQMGIHDYPSNGILRYNYGRFKAEKGDMDAALAQMTKAVELSPSYTLGYYGMGMIYKQLHQPAKAIEYVRRGLAVDPSDPLLQKLLRNLESKKS